jgi:hypothetical protein
MVLMGLRCASHGSSARAAPQAGRSGCVATALSFDLAGVIQNDGGHASPEEHLRRLRKLHGKARGVAV